MQADAASGIPTHDEIASALQEWHSACALAMGSPHYACAVDLVVELLDQHTACAELITAFSCPDMTLMQVVFELCAGEIPLQPRLIIGAAYATRLRQLIGAVM